MDGERRAAKFAEALGNQLSSLGKNPRELERALVRFTNEVEVACSETLRDRFAMSALTGLVDGEARAILVDDPAQCGENMTKLARLSYELAEAMLEARRR